MTYFFLGKLNRNAKTVLLLGLLVLVVAGAVFWASQHSRKKALEADLRAVEEKITQTREEIERFSDLSPEELEKRQREDEILSARSATADVTVEGVDITISGDTKLLKNVAQGYRLELPKNLLLARSIASDHLELHDRDAMCQGDPSCRPVILIEAADLNPDRLALADWFEKEEAKAGSPTYSPREVVALNGADMYRVTESLPPAFDGFYYYWTKGSKVYYLRISKFDEKLYRQYLQSIILL